MKWPRGEEQRWRVEVERGAAGPRAVLQAWWTTHSDSNITLILLACRDSAPPRSPQWAFFFFSAASDRPDCGGEDRASSGDWRCSVKCRGQSDLVRSKVEMGKHQTVRPRGKQEAGEIHPHPLNGKESWVGAWLSLSVSSHTTQTCNWPLWLILISVSIWKMDYALNLLLPFGMLLEFAIWLIAVMVLGATIATLHGLNSWQNQSM